jgi:hypothetical protein
VSQININGGSQPQGGQPRQGVVNDQTYARMQAEMARQQGTSSSSSSTADADYAAALRQRTQQVNQENRAWKQQQATEARLRRERDRSMQAEIRSNDARVRQESNLQQRFRTLEARARQPLTPSSWNTVQRSISNLQFAARGTGAIPRGAFDDLRQSTGTEQSAFKVAQILRQGNIGQGSAIRGGLSGQYTAGKISAELERIEKTLEKQLKLESNPSALAALQRQKDAVYVAKSRLAASGSPGALGGIMRGAGALAGAEWASRLGVYGAAAGAVAGTAYEIAKAPYTANQKLASAYGAGQQYRGTSRYRNAV